MLAVMCNVLVPTSQSPKLERGITAAACAVLGWCWVQVLCQGVLTALAFAVKFSVCKSIWETSDPFLGLVLEIR